MQPLLTVQRGGIDFPRTRRLVVNEQAQTTKVVESTNHGQVQRRTTKQQPRAGSALLPKTVACTGIGQRRGAMQLKEVSDTTSHVTKQQLEASFVVIRESGVFATERVSHMHASWTEYTNNRSYCAHILRGGWHARHRRGQK
jgi:L,D-peptidoglycan transpeptidase YkuD (ErfK/YbiS/YcfS/YnhG family)